MAEAPSSTTPEHDDPLAKALGPSKIEAFLEEHKTKLIIGFSAFVALVIGVILLVSQREANRAEAAQAFTAASTVDELTRVAERYAGTVDGGNALLKKATLLENDGKTGEARSTLIEFRDRYPSHPRVPQALVLLGQMAENEGDRAKARDFYQQVAAESGLAPLARMRLGDLAYQEGRLAEAREAYAEIEREFAENPWAMPLQDRLKEVNLLLEKPEWPEVVLEKPEPAPKPADPAPKPEAPKTLEPKPAESKPAAPAPAPAPATKADAPKTPEPKPVESKPAAPAPAPAPKADAPKTPETKPAEPKPAAPVPAPKADAPKTPESKPVESKPAAPKER